jgi:hypothetical protein
MSLSKLAYTAVMSLALASSAVAEEGAAPVLTTEPAAEAARAAEPSGAAQAAEPSEAAQAAAPSEAVEAAVPSDPAQAAPAEAEAGVPAALEQNAAPVAEAAPAAAEAKPASPRMALGPIGHDAQGRPGRIHVVQGGDTLWDISDAYLGTPWVWPSLWKDNDAIRNPHLIHPGDRLWISRYEMRTVSEAEAAALLAAQDAGTAAPAALAETDAMPAPPRSLGSYHYPEIDTTGFVTREQYEGAASILESAEPRKWLSEQSEVVIGLGNGEVQVGDQFDIFRTEARVTDLDTGMQYGWATNQLGWLEVTRVDEESSRALIRLSRSEVQRGDHLLPRRVRSAEIPIGGSPGPVEGRVVHTPDRRLQMSQTDIVYLDRGTRDGLSIGSPLEIYRPLGDHGKKLDSAQNQERRIADHVVAKLLVVDVFDDTAVAVVTHTTEELNRGDSFRGSDSVQP